MRLTIKFKMLERPIDNDIAIDRKELYGSDEPEPAPPAKSYQHKSLFHIESRQLIDKLKAIATNEVRVENKLEEIYRLYFLKYKNNAYDLQNIKDMKKFLEKIYFQIKTIKESDTKANFDGVINNLEFACLDGAVAKIIDLSDFLETNPNKLFFNAKFEYIKQLAIEETPLSSGANQIHFVMERLNYLAPQFKTSIQHNDQYVSNNKVSPEFLLSVSNKFDNGEAAEAIVEILSTKLIDALPDNDFVVMSKYDSTLYHGIQESILKVFNNYGFSEALSEKVAFAILDTQEDYTISGYKANYHEMIRSFEELGYLENCIIKLEDGELVLLNDSVYSFNFEDKSYHKEISDLKKFSEFHFRGKNIKQHLQDAKFMSINIANFRKFAINPAMYSDEATMLINIDQGIHYNLINSKFNKIPILVSPNAIDAYKHNLINLRDLIELEINKIVVLTSREASYIYKSNFVKFSDLVDLDVDKIKALISSNALQSYHYSFTKFSNLVGFDADKIEALTSYSAFNTYHSDFVKFSDLADFDVDKIAALTSNYAIDVYKFGIIPSDLAGLSTDAIIMLLSDQSNIIQSNHPEKLDAEKIRTAIFYRVKAYHVEPTAKALIYGIDNIHSFARAADDIYRYFTNETNESLGAQKFVGAHDKALYATRSIISTVLGFSQILQNKSGWPTFFDALMQSVKISHQWERSDSVQKCFLVTSMTYLTNAAFFDFATTTSLLPAALGLSACTAKYLEASYAEAGLNIINNAFFMYQAGIDDIFGKTVSVVSSLNIFYTLNDVWQDYI